MDDNWRGIVKAEAEAEEPRQAAEDVLEASVEVEAEDVLEASEEVEAEDVLEGEIEGMGETNPAYTSAVTGIIAKNRLRGREDQYLTTADQTVRVLDNEDAMILNKLRKSLGSGELKLVFAINTCFFRQHRSDSRKVQISTKWLADRWLIDYKARDMATPEEQKAEDERVEKNMENFKHKLRRLLQNIAWTSFSYTERTRTKGTRYGNIGIIGPDFYVDDSYVRLELAEQYSISIKKRNLITMIPDAVYRIDDRRDNAISLANKLIENYSMYQNILKGRDNFLAVETLLEQTSYEDLKALQTVTQPKTKQDKKAIPAKSVKQVGDQSATKVTWKKGVKGRFEGDMAYLQTAEVGLIKSWQYTHHDRTPLTKAEIDGLKSFHGIFIVYELANYPSHSERFTAAKRWKVQAEKEVKNKRDANRRRQKLAEQKRET